jgi:steroid delta-isomerase-like uncharacterized protein
MAAARDVLERLLEALNAHDIEAARRLYSPRARIVTATGRRLDADGYSQMHRKTLSAFPDLLLEITRWVEDDEQHTVATEEVLTGTHKGTFAGLPPTNRPVRLPIAHITRVVDGAIVERIAYHDTAGILRQLQGRPPL